MTTTLRFIGDWSLLYGLPLAAVLAWAAWRLYRRETRALKGVVSWLLPLLRSMAVALIVLMLTGPVLHHRTVVGRTGRVLVVADASKSMGVDDAALSPGRKVLIAAELGLVPRDLLDKDLPVTEAALLRAQTATGVLLKEKGGNRESEKAVAGIVRDAQEAMDHIGRKLSEGFRREVLDPAFALERAGEGLDGQLTVMVETIERWRGRVRQETEARAAETAKSGRAEVTEAIKKFDAMTRWERMQKLLLEEDDALLAQLARTNHVEYSALNGAQAETMWVAPAGVVGTERPVATRTIEGVPGAMFTDLEAGLRMALGRSTREADNSITITSTSTKMRGGGEEKEPVAVVILSDGRHNFGESPLGTAKACGEQGMAIFTVGFGPERPLADLAVDRVEAPQSVYYKDHLRGRIYLKDDLGAGKDFKVKVLRGEQVMWEQAMQTTGEHQRAVDFEFGVEEVLKGVDKDKDRNTITSTSTATLSTSRPPEGGTMNGEALDLRVVAEVEDQEPRNNQQEFHVRATYQRKRILLLDGRPRWELRYLRDLFERDAKWEVTTLVADPLAPGGGLRRGNDGKSFPDRREGLLSYDLVILGDFPAQGLSAEEQDWLRGFVGERGGGLILIDGERNHLKEYPAGKLGELVPVAWTDAGAPAARPSALRLTEKGKLRLTRPGLELAALTLAAEAGANVAIWDSLLPPHWLAGVKALPGAEVFMEAVVDGQGYPALVGRRYGAGKVLYAAFDESWRFRYRVADLHHSRYWSQVAGWIMAPSYAVSNKFVALDAGALVHPAGASVEIRGQVRDPQGRTVTQAKVTAHLEREGKEVATVPLQADAEAGEYRGNSGALEAGRYEVRLEVSGYSSEQTAARTVFHVQAPQAGELTELSCNETLLKQIAAETSGESFREESARDLAARIEPFLRPKVIESETLLWQSYWWFGAVALLLTVEWLVRKRRGMV